MKQEFSEVSQSSTDVGVMLLNAAVALSDKFLHVALDLLTIATQTDRQTDGRTDRQIDKQRGHSGPCKQCISSMRRCPRFIGCRQRREEGLQEASRRAGGGGGRWAGEHRTAAVASEAEIGFLLSSARQSPPLSRQSK